MKNNRNNTNDMYVIKRNNKKEPISFDKILKRIKSICKEFNLQNIIYAQLAMKVIDQLYDNIETTKIDELTAQQCCSMASIHPDYNKLASAISISNLQKNTSNSFYESIKKLYDFKDVNNNNFKLISNNIMNIVEENKELFDSIIDYKRDFIFDYFGFKTLERAYLMKCNNIIVERPQHMWMRVSITIHGSNIEKVKTTYDYMSQKYFIHATPTLFNAGTPRPQLSSCYLIGMEDDSIDGIFNTVKECAQISKWSGGIGLHVHNIRSCGSHIRGTNGTSNGLIPMLGVFNKTARYVDQGGKRNGSFAIYLEPHHPDIEEFLELKKNHGDEESKCRDLFYALWLSDLFMERVFSNKEWSLFCPDKCPGLSDCYGEEYKKLYLKYEEEKRYNKQIGARDLWVKILDAQMETGTPYLLYKDAVNNKSNQKNLGIIKSSNLCTEITEYSDKNETAVCNLASIGLPMYVNDEDKTFNYDKLHDVTKVITRNLDKIIDVNFYPTEKTQHSNMRHRPIGIGVQGLADVFILLGLEFNSDESKEINNNIFETIYHASMEASYEIALERYNDYQKDKKSVLITKEEKSQLSKEHIGAYSSFTNSPLFFGKFQFDLWNEKPSNRYDWDDLRQKVMMRGVRNSLLVAPMPTASTSQILGNNECFEPITSNIYSRSTLAGEFMVANKHLMKELLELGLWNDEVKNNIIENKGSVKYIDGIPEKIKNKYKTVWEIPMKDVILMAKDRGKYICQSQSLNLFVNPPQPKIIHSILMYGWKIGLKTGSYYIRTKSILENQNFTTEISKEKKTEPKECLMCGA